MKYWNFCLTFWLKPLLRVKWLLIFKLSLLCLRANIADMFSYHPLRQSPTQPFWSRHATLLPKQSGEGLCVTRQKQLCKRQQWRTKELGTVWKSPSKVTAPNDNFWIGFGFIPSSPPPLLPPAMLWPKKHSFLPTLLKIQVCFRVGGEWSVVLLTSL